MDGAAAVPGQGSCRKTLLLGAETEIEQLTVGPNQKCSFDLLVEQSGGLLWWESSTLPVVHGAWRIEATATSPDPRDPPIVHAWTGLLVDMPPRSVFSLVTDARVGTWRIEATYYPQETAGQAIDTGEWVFKACHDRDESPEDGDCLDDVS